MEYTIHLRSRLRVTMPHYRLYVLQDDNGITRAVDYDFDSDDKAVAVVAERHSCETVELWSGARRVARLQSGVKISN